MLSSKTKQLVLHALQVYQGDDLERAERSFPASISASDRAYLERLRERRREIKTAIDEVKQS